MRCGPSVSLNRFGGLWICNPRRQPCAPVRPPHPTPSPYARSLRTSPLVAYNPARCWLATHLVAAAALPFFLPMLPSRWRRCCEGERDRSIGECECMRVRAPGHLRKGCAPLLERFVHHSPPTPMEESLGSTVHCHVKIKPPHAHDPIDRTARARADLDGASSQGQATRQGAPTN